MPHFAVFARDVPASAASRSAARQAHFVHIERVLKHIAIAGPLKDAEGIITGSLIVLEAADQAEARALIEADPYFAAGVWADIEIHPFLAAVGTWVGGKTW